MTLENKVVLTTSIVVDIDAEEHGSSPRMEMLIRKLQNTIDDAFAPDDSVQPTGSIAFDWLNDPRTNFGRCVDCNRLVSNYRKPHRIPGLLDASVIDGNLLCDECNYFRREAKENHCPSPTETTPHFHFPMSTRTYALSVKSLAPIRDAIASQNEAAYNAVISEFDADDVDRRNYAKSLIFAKNPPAKEPGCWNYVVEPLAKHFGLEPTYLPIDDWKHYAAWEGYRTVADTHLSSDARTLLGYIESGRPFRGTEIDYDGCLFGWLTNAESATLLSELRNIDANFFADVDLDELHEELIESLQTVVDDGTEMFIGAS